MSAGFSPEGRDLAAQAADVLFTNLTQLGQIPGVLGDIRQYMAARGRTISVFTMSHVVCRPTRCEAEEFFHYFAEEMADEEGQDYYRRMRGTTAGSGQVSIARPFDTHFNLATGKRFAGRLSRCIPAGRHPG